ncbi:chromate transporter [Flindersiella endophytica]
MRWLPDGGRPRDGSDAGPQAVNAGRVFAVFLRLGLTSFGGPVAHLGYFRETFVVRRRWLSEQAYTDLVALCQFLPGPASSQVAMAIGLQQARWRGLLAAWAGFTLPSAIVLVAFAYGVEAAGLGTDTGWLQGLKAAVVAVVAQAVIAMARVFASDHKRAGIALAATIATVLVPAVWVQVAVIALAAVAGLCWLPPPAGTDQRLEAMPGRPARRGAAAGCLALFGSLLVVLPTLAAVTHNGTARLADSFYRAGALVFGGGHVVLPLLQASTVETGLVDHDVFLAGYGAAQAMPGPLFTFAAYLGAVVNTSPTGIAGAALALIAIFLPSALLVAGALPFWERLRAVPLAQRALTGVNASVVGILAAALYTPVSTQGMTTPATMAIAAAAFVALTNWQLPAWSVVLGAGIAGLLLL